MKPRAVAAPAVLAALATLPVLRAAWDAGEAAASDSHAARRHACEPAIDCPPLRVQTPEGEVFFMGTRGGEVPSVMCPQGTEYSGPALECGWVGRRCLKGDGEAGASQTCWDEYNLTRRGMGLSEWPASVEPGLVDSLCTPAGGSGPAVELVAPEDLRCRSRTFVDLDFGSAAVKRNRHGQETCSAVGPCCQWSLRFEGVAAVDGGQRMVDLLVCNLEESGHRALATDGVVGSSGRVSVRKGEDAELLFRFVDGATGQPEVLEKVLLSVFELDDGADGERDMQITASPLQEFYVSRDSRLRTDQRGPGTWRFSRDASRVPKEGAVDEGAARARWQGVLDRSVVLAFAGTAEFTLLVHGGPEEPCGDAVKGDQCYDSVEWAMKEGITKHPDWYPGLGPDSPFSAFQAFLSPNNNSGANCPLPCREDDPYWLPLEFSGWSLLAQIGEATQCAEDGPDDAQAGVVAGFGAAPPLVARRGARGARAAIATSVAALLAAAGLAFAWRLRRGRQLTGGCTGAGGAGPGERDVLVVTADA